MSLGQYIEYTSWRVYIACEQALCLQTREYTILKLNGLV